MLSKDEVTALFVLIQGDSSTHGRACAIFSDVTSATKQEGNEPVEAASMDSHASIADATSDSREAGRDDSELVRWIRGHGKGSVADSGDVRQHIHMVEECLIGSGSAVADTTSHQYVIG